MSPQHFLHYKYMGKIFDTLAWHGTRPKFYACPRYLQVWRRSDQNRRRHRVHNIFSSAQEQVTPKSMDGHGRNSNTSEILCLSCLPASLTNIWSNVKAIAWRHGFSHYKPIGAFCCHGNHSFNESAPKHKSSLSLHPTDATYKICSRLANWSWRFHNKTIKNLICHQGHVPPKVTDLIWPTLKRAVWSVQHSNSSCQFLLYASLKKIGSKLKALAWRHRFPHYNRCSLLPWKPELWSNLSQMLMQPFPPPQWCYT